MNQMDTMTLNLEFGFFAEELAEEEHHYVSNILSNATCKGLELAWDPAEYMTVGVYQPLLNSTEGISFGTVPANLEQISNLPVPDGPQWHPAEGPSAVENLPEVSVSQEVSTPLVQISPDVGSAKPARQYERRNKKRRPPGYYDNLRRSSPVETDGAASPQMGLAQGGTVTGTGQINNSQGPTTAEYELSNNVQGSDVSQNFENVNRASPGTGPINEIQQPSYEQTSDVVYPTYSAPNPGSSYAAQNNEQFQNAPTGASSLLPQQQVLSGSRHIGQTGNAPVVVSVKAQMENTNWSPHQIRHNTPPGTQMNVMPPNPVRAVEACMEQPRPVQETVPADIAGTVNTVATGVHISSNQNVLTQKDTVQTTVKYPQNPPQDSLRTGFVINSPQAVESVSQNAPNNSDEQRLNAPATYPSPQESDTANIGTVENVQSSQSNEGNRTELALISQDNVPKVSESNTSSVPSEPASAAPVQTVVEGEKPNQDDSSPAAPQPKPKPSSWAGLFKSSNSSSSSVSSSSSSSVPFVSHVNSESSTRGSTPASSVESEKDQLPVIVSVNEDCAARKLGDLLVKCVPVYTPVALQPRGLCNRANWCYTSATLQALLACPPFYHLIKYLPSFPKLERGASSTPVMDCMVNFVNEFSPMKQKPTEIKPVGGHKGAKGPVMLDLHPGPMFEPTYVYKMLQVIKYDAAFKHGHQEDAEEFLSCILNGLHDEMVAAINLVHPKEKSPDEPKPSPNGQTTDIVAYDADDEEETWEQVGPKNKSVITRAAHFSQSPVSDIFGGQIRSILHQSGVKESATLQPFFTLQLDTHGENIWSVKDALDHLVCKETLQGYTSSKTKQEVEASRRIMLEVLPPVLVLHLKCFIYDKSGGCQKVLKKIDLETKLDICKDLLSSNARSKYSHDQRTYKLIAVVNHHGARAIGGHYSADVYHPGVDGWVRCDDSNIKSVGLNQVLKYSPPRMPYLLYYQRSDTV